MRSRYLFASLLTAAVATVSAVACSGTDTATSDPVDGAGQQSPAGSTATEPGAASAALALEQGRTVIDVRTPEEYAEGHVADATNLDVQSDTFDTELAALDPDGAYVVYCRSGNRSAAAAAQMLAAGLDVLDGGALTTMLDAGWPAA